MRNFTSTLKQRNISFDSAFLMPGGKDEIINVFIFLEKKAIEIIERASKLTQADNGQNDIDLFTVIDKMQYEIDKLLVAPDGHSKNWTKLLEFLRGILDDLNEEFNKKDLLRKGMLGTFIKYVFTTNERDLATSRLITAMYIELLKTKKINTTLTFHSYSTKQPIEFIAKDRSDVNFINLASWCNTMYGAVIGLLDAKYFKYKIFDERTVMVKKFFEELYNRANIYFAKYPQLAPKINAFIREGIQQK